MVATAAMGAAATSSNAAVDLVTRMITIDAAFQLEAFAHGSGMTMLFAYVLAGLASDSALQPTGKWVVEFADSACVASRSFGTPDKRLDFHLKAPMLGQNFEIVIVVPDSKRPQGNGYDEGWIERPDGSRAAPITAGSYSTVSKTQVTRIYVDPEKYIIGQDGERIILQINKERRYDLALPDLQKVQRVLNQCLTNLRDDYGVGENVTKQIATPAESKQSLIGYFNTDDYPSEAVAKGEQGYVGVLYWVETDGRVKECKIVESSRRQSLDGRTCEIIRRRARFTPAQDQQGKAIRSPKYQRIRWEMPS
jgi:TonB family protein